MDKVITVNIEKCLACKSCELACAVAHSLAKALSAAVVSGEKPGYRVNVEVYEGHAVPVHCQHCEEAACVIACPTGALHRDEQTGRVLVERERCIGCGMCVQACPFGVITMHPDGKGVLKCDLCMDRLAAGREPACVEACPTKALVFCEEKEASKNRRRQTAAKMVLAQQSDAAKRKEN